VNCRAYFGYKGHINNLYNTTFWALIQNGGMDAKEAEKALAVRFLMVEKASSLTI
jgi:tRNA(His) 5'-end guanylyltransferase